MTNRCLLRSAILMCCLGPTLLTAQWSALTDSERVRISNIPSQAERVDTLNEWAYNNGKRAIAKYAATALELAEKDNNRMGASDAHIQLGSAAEDEMRYKTAAFHYEMALRARLLIKNHSKTASAYNRLSQVKTKEGQYNQAIDWAQKGLSLMALQPPHVNIAYLHEALGNAARLAGRFAEADSAFHAGLRMYGQLAGEDAGQASLRMSYAAFLQECRYRYPAAKDSLLKSLKMFESLGRHSDAGKCLLFLGNNAYYIRQLNSAMAYYTQGIQMQTHLEQVDYHQLLENRGRVLMEQGHYKPAYRDIQSALRFFATQQDTANWTGALFESGNCFYEQNQLDSAVFYYQQAASLPKQAPLQQGRLLFFLSDALSQMGRQEEAAQYTDAYLAFLNSLSNTQTIGVFEALNRQQLDKNRLLMKATKQKKRTTELYALTGLSVLALLAFLFFFNARLHRQKRRLAERNAEVARQREALASQQSELARQNEQLAVQEKLEMLHKKEMETQYARLEGQDMRQNEIGKELHDGVGATLSTVKLNLPVVEEVLDCIPPGKRDQYIQANQLLDQACEELRRVSHALSSAVLDNFGLKTQLEIFANAVSGSGKLKVELALHGLKERLSDYKTELNIYRMVQELVRNVIKHAQAQNIAIEVNRFEDSINIIVEDDGQGFDTEAVLHKPGLGLSSLAARVQELDGEFQIDSRPGRGTTVSIDVPIAK